jgi:hypothetical protein
MKVDQRLVSLIISKREISDCLRKTGIGTDNAYSLERSSRKSRATQYK